MAAPQLTIETRRAQMFPVLEHAELERVRRFGEVRAFAAGEALAKVGERGHGLIIVLAGKVQIAQRDNITAEVGGYSASPGYNAVSGWGTPDGVKLAQAIIQALAKAIS
jgi:hypothetical protein